MELIVTTPETLRQIVDSAVRLAVYDLRGVINAEGSGPSDDDIIDTPETMRIMGYKHPGSVRRDVQKGNLKPINKVEGKNIGKRGYRFRRGDVEAYARTK
ncbi:MAG TPA: hypothetical protein VEY71_04710 [Chitinophagales bacterium]|nr:hypothetical protein [Chitinophagales bacterium]